MLITCAERRLLNDRCRLSLKIKFEYIWVDLGCVLWFSFTLNIHQHNSNVRVVVVAMRTYPVLPKKSILKVTLVKV